MKVVARFEKVSFDRFIEDWKSVNDIPFVNIDEAHKMYDSIKLPIRATKGSAGYDFYIPYGIKIPYDTTRIISTGIRCKIEDGWFLNICPRSGNGFKYGVHLANTVGIIDSDYYNAINEGHIMIKIVNDSVVNVEKQIYTIEKNSAFCQGIFLEYGVVYGDTVNDERIGGFGSTGE